MTWTKKLLAEHPDFAEENEGWHPSHLQEIAYPKLFQKHASDLQHM
jgi:hypothetical protein